MGSLAVKAKAVSAQGVWKLFSCDSWFKIGTCDVVDPLTRTEISATAPVESPNLHREY